MGTGKWGERDVQVERIMGRLREYVPPDVVSAPEWVQMANARLEALLSELGFRDAQVAEAEKIHAALTAYRLTPLAPLPREKRSINQQARFDAADAIAQHELTPLNDEGECDADDWHWKLEGLLSAYQAALKDEQGSAP